MKRSQRLQPITEIAAHREQEASKRMATAHNTLEEHREMLNDLERYHAEYTQSQGMQLNDAVRLQDFRLFMDRLEHAIARQRTILAALEHEYEVQHSDWTDRRSQRQALDKVGERFTREERHLAEGDEQRQLEEVAALLRGRDFQG